MSLTLKRSFKIQEVLREKSMVKIEAFPFSYLWTVLRQWCGKDFRWKWAEFKFFSIGFCFSRRVEAWLKEISCLEIARWKDKKKWGRIVCTLVVMLWEDIPRQNKQCMLLQLLKKKNENYRRAHFIYYIIHRHFLRTRFKGKMEYMSHHMYI